MTQPVIDARGRVRDPAREKRLARQRLVRTLAIALTLLGVLAWLLTSSPLLAVRTIDVVGASAIAPDAIREASGVRTGMPIARVDTAQAARAVAEIPGVADDRVSISLPGTVTITVTERQPVAAVAVTGGFGWLDETGRLYRTGATRPQGVPLVEVPDVRDGAVLAVVAQVSKAVPERLRGQLKEVDAKSVDSVTLTTKAGTTIFWGGADHPEVKGELADVLIKAKPSCKRIDVSAFTNPTTTC